MADVEKRSVAGPSGVTLFGLLGLAFIVMKLGGWGVVAAWSWWWVLAPFWGPIVLITVIALIGFALAVFITAIMDSCENKGRHQ